MTTTDSVTPDDTKSTAANRAAPLSLTRAVDLLGEPLRSVLLAGHDVMSAASDDIDADAVSDVNKLHLLINTFGEHPQLRRISKRRCADLIAKHAGAPAAEVISVVSATEQFLAPDDKTAAAGVVAVRGLLTKAVAAQRTARRREQRRDARTPEERAAEHAETQLSKAREQRDRAEGRLKAAEAEARTLRLRLAAMDEAHQDAQQRHLDAERQLDRLRDRNTDPRALSGLLAEQLTRYTTEARHPAEGGRAEDPFAVLDHHVDALTTLLTSPAPAGAADSSEGATTPLESWTPVRQTLAAALSMVTAPPLAFTREMSLQVEVLGAGTEIGGSCVLVQAAGTRVLIDCGMRMKGTTKEALAPPGYATALSGDLHAVVITHAHNDHAGWVPALVADRPGLPVYATPATCDLLGTMWRDSAKVMALNGVRGYSLSDVDRAIGAFSETAFRSVVRVGELTIELFAAGHIVGAASVVVTAGNERVVISGDVSAAGQETVGGFSPSGTSLDADLLLLESTYAGEHKTMTPRGTTVAAMMREVETVASRGGIVLIPAFALGRAQEVALLMRRHLPEVPVLVDGLARAVTEVYERHGPDGRPRSIYGANVRPVPGGGTERAAHTFAGGVVITTSGMLNTGPAVRWAKRVLPDPNSALMVVGYQDEESPGARLLRLADAGGGTFDLPTRDGDEHESVEVYAEVSRYQLGAHANANELATIVAQMRPRRLMLVHGERRSQESFRNRMTTRAQVTIDTGSWAAR